ncbi:MAG: hypothetical protein H6635_07200 [Anaerolineales bacterium]|nr:hypothetical protein [Anaerolineales bacterium]MCB9145139.1 hypothetical protein [Anaerolineales bacterium]
MEILGIGLPELIFIFIIALLILGPRDMQKSAKTVGIWLNKFINSNAYRILKNSSNEIKNMSTNLMREANMEMQKTDAQIRKEMQLDPRVSKFVVNSDGDRPMGVHNMKTAQKQEEPAPAAETTPESDSKQDA